jgi:hypothetical protein
MRKVFEGRVLHGFSGRGYDAAEEWTLWVLEEENTLSCGTGSNIIEP